MGTIQNDTEGKGSVWRKSISAAREMLDCSTVSEALIVEALTSAHRDRNYPYSSDGNRELSGVGRMVLTSCIKLGESEEEFSSQIPDWKDLRDGQTILRIAEHSTLGHCIVPSIRQNNEKTQVPLSKKIVANALFGLIGAVYLDYKRDKRRVCHAISALCRYISQDGDNGHWPAHFNDFVNFDGTEMNDHSPCPQDIVMPDAPGAFDPGRGLAIQSHLGSTPSHDGFGSPNAMHSLESSTPFRNRGTSDSSSRKTMGEAETSHVSRVLQGITLVHTCEQGQQEFIIAKPQPLETPDQKQMASRSPVAKGRRSHECSAMRLMDEYERHHHARWQQQVSTATTPVSPRPKMTADEFSEYPKHRQTMRKMILGSVRTFSIIAIKKALAARRSGPPSGVDASNENVTNAICHYRQISRLSEYQAQNNIETNYHIYKLYVALRGNVRKALDHGFMNSDQRDISESVNDGKVARKGNPLTRNLSKEYKAMLYCAEPDFEYRPLEEQNRLTNSMTRLRRLGVHMDRFVSAFGIGALCFLPFKSACQSEQHFLAVSETDFINIPDSKGRELDALIKRMKLYDHPIGLFAVAAEPVLSYIVNTQNQRQGRFRCENTDTAQIQKMIDCSPDLLAQLDVV